MRLLGGGRAVCNCTTRGDVVEYRHGKKEFPEPLRGRDGCGGHRRAEVRHWLQWQARGAGLSIPKADKETTDHDSMGQDAGARNLQRFRRGFVQPEDKVGFPVMEDFPEEQGETGKLNG